MSKKIGFLQRWMFIIDKINARPYITKEELEEAIANELLLQSRGMRVIEPLHLISGIRW